ncbi:MAG: hypothetical protein ACRCWR_12970 [Saezia sp.]
MSKLKIFLIGFITPIALLATLWVLSYFTQTSENTRDREQLEQILASIKPIQQNIQQNITFSENGNPQLLSHQNYMPPQAKTGIHYLQTYPNGDIILFTQANQFMHLSPEQKNGTIQWTCTASPPETVPSYCHN